MLQFLIAYLVILSVIVLKDRYLLLMLFMIPVAPILTSILGVGVLSLDLVLSLSSISMLLFVHNSSSRVFHYAKPFLGFLLIGLMHLMIRFDTQYLREMIYYLSSVAALFACFTYVRTDQRYRSVVRISQYALVVMTVYVAIASGLGFGTTSYGGSSSVIFLGGFSLWNFICYVYLMGMMPSSLAIFRNSKYWTIILFCLCTLVVLLITKRNHIIMVGITAMFIFLYKPKRYFQFREFVLILTIAIIGTAFLYVTNSLIEQRLSVREQAFNVRIEEHSRTREITLYPYYLRSDLSNSFSILFGSGRYSPAKRLIADQLNEDSRDWHTGIAHALYGYGLIGLVFLLAFFRRLFKWQRKLMSVPGLDKNSYMYMQAYVMFLLLVYGVAMEWMQSLQSSVLPFALYGSILGYIDSQKTDQLT